MATVDVVLVCYNGAHTIADALDSVFALSEVQADPNFARVVVVDNASSDGSRALIRERYGARVQLIENDVNLGFGAACNRAFAATASPYVFLLNPDAQLKAAALANAVAFMIEHPRCGIAGARVVNPDGTIQPSCGEFETWLGAFLRSSAWGEWPPFQRFANGAGLRGFGYDRPARVDLVIGAAMLIRRALLAEIGGFDERFFLYQEEVDLAKRAAGAGWETWFVPSSEAIHVGRASSSTRVDVEGHKRRSRRIYWIKHHGYLWYAALVAALVGRYVLYLLVTVGAVQLGRLALRGR